MKRLLFLVILLLIALCGQSQTINQKGVTYRYNGKNKRTPIGGVYIKPITAANGVVSDEQNGTFTLALDNLKMGSRIGNVRVTKQGMMVFNQQAVDEWNVRKEPLCLILCDADEFQKQKKNLIAIGESQAKRKYDKQLLELKKQNDAKQLQIDDYYNKLDSLEKEYHNALKHMDEYADVFARIDESEIDTIVQRAIVMFNRGEIEESIHLLEQQNYMEKIKRANCTIEQANAMISTAEQAKSLAEQDKVKYIEGVKTQIAGYKLQNEWYKAKELLKGLADNLNTYEAIWEYAKFCQTQNDYKEAEVYYLKYKEQLDKDKDMEEDEKYIMLTSLQNNMGNLYYSMKRDAECETMYKTASDNYKHLAKSNPSVFERYWAGALNNLAMIYHDTRRYSESEEMYKSALEIRKRLAKTNPSVYDSDLVATLNNMGVLYFDTRRYSQSEEMYKSALEIRERLVKFNPFVYEYESGLAVIKHNLGNLYYMTLRYTESEEMYKSALEIRKRLAKTNPSVYDSDLVATLNNMGVLYFDTRRYSQSEEMYKSALEIREHLAKTNPSVYDSDLAVSKFNIGKLYNETQRYSESETMYKSALEINECLAKYRPSIYESYVAEIRKYIADLYQTTKRYSESEKMYKSALELYERLSVNNQSAYELKILTIYLNLALLYSEFQHYPECEAMYNAALNIYLRWNEDNPQVYEKDMLECYYWLGRLKLLMGKKNEAQDSFKQSLNLARQMHKRGIETPSYWEILYFLSDIMNNEKDYVSAYTYIEELLPLLKALYMDNSEKYKYLISGKLISQSYYANLLGKFSDGEHYSLEALEVDSTKHIAYTNLAAALLFQGKVEEAEKLYRQYKSEIKDEFLADFLEFERLGVIPKERKKNVERIKAMLKNE